MILQMSMKRPGMIGMTARGKKIYIYGCYYWREGGAGLLMNTWSEIHNIPPFPSANSTGGERRRKWRQRTEMAALTFYLYPRDNMNKLKVLELRGDLKKYIVKAKFKRTELKDLIKKALGGKVAWFFCWWKEGKSASRPGIKRWLLSFDVVEGSAAWYCCSWGHPK